MAKIFLITLDPTTSPGPFNIYYNTVSDDTLIAATPNSATKASLLLGVNVSVDDDVNDIYLENLANGCLNKQGVNVLPPTTTTTSTTSTTTSTTTLPPTTTTTSTTTLPPTTTTTSTTTLPPTTTTTSTTTSTSTTTTTTAGPCDCKFYDVNVSQDDLDDATGNTMFLDNTLYVEYTDCDNNQQTKTYDIAGTYTNDFCALDNTFIYVNYYKNDNIAVPQFSGVDVQGDCCD
jgi:hypothetical protein